MNQALEMNTRLQITDPAAHAAAIRKALGARRLESSPCARIVAPLLLSLDWFGTPRSLFDALPDDVASLSFSELKTLLAGLGFRLRPLVAGTSLLQLPPSSLLVGEDAAWVLTAEGWHDGSQVQQDSPSLRGGALFVAESDPDFQPLGMPAPGWLRSLLMAARREIGGILALSLVSNLLALVTSLFTMYVYNSVIPAGASHSMWAIGIGALIAVLGAWWMRLLRLKLSAQLTASAGQTISDMAWRKTLSLPAESSTRLGVENNLSRLRSIESTRQWFGGAGGTVTADYPFIVIFLLVIALLGGWIVLVPLGGLVLFALASWPLSQYIRSCSTRASVAASKLNEMSSVLTNRLRAVRGVPGEGLWSEKLVDLVAQAALANKRHALANALSQALSQAITMLIVLATLGTGVFLVLSNVMNAGGLIATMMLIWRVTTPAQQYFASQVRMGQLADAGRQLDRLMLTPSELSSPKLSSPLATLSPSLEIDRLFYRYAADREAALSSISFNVEAGQLVAVVGPNGSGKSCLLQVLAGVRIAQNGRVLVGGRDVRQFDPADFRAWIGYLPQEVRGLPLNVREAMKLRHSFCDDTLLSENAVRVLGEDWYRLLGARSVDEAFEIQITPGRQDRQAVQIRFIVRLLAATLGEPPLILLDDPLGDLDPLLDTRFTRWLQSVKGHSTVILATHRPDLIQVSDRIAVLNEGALVHFGPVSAPASQA